MNFLFSFFSHFFYLFIIFLLIYLLRTLQITQCFNIMSFYFLAAKFYVFFASSNISILLFGVFFSDIVLR